MQVRRLPACPRGAIAWRAVFCCGCCSGPSSASARLTAATVAVHASLSRQRTSHDPASFAIGVAGLFSMACGPCVDAA